MATKGIRSLEPLLAQIDKERVAQLQHFDSLHAKAGIVLGLAGALIALSHRPTDGSVLSVISSTSVVASTSSA